MCQYSTIFCNNMDFAPQASFTTKIKEQRWVAADVLHEGM
jgi:hypothetical protein